MTVSPTAETATAPLPPAPTAAAAPAPALALRTQAVVTADTALHLVALALAEGARRGIPVSATVVDPGMGLIACAKADEANPHGLETSRRKACTAASKRRPTGWMGGQLALTLPLASGNALTDVRGGLPIRYDGLLGGGLGVAGGTEDDDAEIAAAVLAAAGADRTE
ncbi:hypothetical protein Kpho01_00310 [Kitasatospora phosalacinea]|uniref:Heme-binding protein n=1 Tax=Kitasatospora phosalacinea TaxID=2065 RepID=A0A9W6ULZ9_9ACTN|nr:hypothetical protein Kpho01_00310 [Kitasatospora phosalacinea]